MIKNLSKRLQEIAKFRNVVVQYVLVNKVKLFKIVKESTKDIKY